ncbi:MAG: sulfite exporter TauE/SafE family protein [Myxococcota bacterium]
MTDPMVAHIAILVVAGVVVGYASGLFGIGGGVILVPTFLTVFPLFGVGSHVIMHCAVGTCLALVVPAAIASAWKHRALGNLDVSFLRKWVPGVVVGTVIGALTVTFLHTRDLKIIFTVYLILTTLYVAFTKASETGEESGPGRGAVVVGSTVIANLSVWLGLGGGTFSVPYLRAFHYPMRKAIAVSAATGVVIGTGGAIGAIIQGIGVPGRSPYAIGFVDGLSFGVIAPIVMVFAPLGAKAAAKAPDLVLKWTYVALLAGISVYMSVRTL